jgi:hypothetical protein
MARPHAGGMARPSAGVRAFVAAGIVPGSGSRLRPEGPRPDLLRRGTGKIGPAGIRPARIRPHVPERNSVPGWATGAAGSAGLARVPLAGLARVPLAGLARVPLAGLSAAARPWRARPFPWVL